MTPDDLTKPLRKRPANRRRDGILLPIVAGTLTGVLSGLAILLAANSDRDKPLQPAPAPQPALADSLQQTAPLAVSAPTVPTTKTITITVVDSQTGARREVVVPAPTNDQSQNEIALRAADMEKTDPVTTGAATDRGRAKTKSPSH